MQTQLLLLFRWHHLLHLLSVLAYHHLPFLVTWQQNRYVFILLRQYCTWVSLLINDRYRRLILKNCIIFHICQVLHIRWSGSRTLLKHHMLDLWCRRRVLHWYHILEFARGFWDQRFLWALVFPSLFHCRIFLSNNCRLNCLYTDLWHLCSCVNYFVIKSVDSPLSSELSLILLLYDRVEVRNLIVLLQELRVNFLQLRFHHRQPQLMFLELLQNLSMILTWVLRHNFDLSEI